MHNNKITSYWTNIAPYRCTSNKLDLAVTMVTRFLEIVYFSFPAYCGDFRQQRLVCVIDKSLK